MSEAPALPPRTRVLVVDDTAVARLLLVYMLEEDPRMEVMAAVPDGNAALEFLQQNRPDVIVMDINMPGLDGFETTRRIMESAQPVPIVICSATSNPSEVAIAFRAMEAGAVACVGKPVSAMHPDYAALSRRLLDTIALMAEVKVVRRWSRGRVAAVPTPPLRGFGSLRFVGIGASTGGPPVLQTILAGLPKDFPVPLLIVQHIAPGFLGGFVDWLNHTSSLNAQIAAHGILPQPGHAYIAPDDFHMCVDIAGRIVLSRGEPDAGLRPSVSSLFRSLAQHCGAGAVGVLLTGMGKDGAAELKLMRERGADTIAQDRETSVVHGMPGEAIALGAATQILPADRIAPALQMLAHDRKALKGARQQEGMP